MSSQREEQAKLFSQRIFPEKYQSAELRGYYLRQEAKWFCGKCLLDLNRELSISSPISFQK